MTIANASTGEVYYTFEDGNLDDVGRIELELQTTRTNLKLTTNSIKEPIKAPSLK